MAENNIVEKWQVPSKQSATQRTRKLEVEGLAGWKTRQELVSLRRLKKIERDPFRRCHNSEYLTLLNTSPNATTRDRQGIDEYQVREFVDRNPPRV